MDVKRRKTLQKWLLTALKGKKQMKIKKSQLLKMIKEEVAKMYPNDSAKIAQEIQKRLEQAQMSKSYGLTGPPHEWFEGIAALAKKGMALTPKVTQKLNEDTLDDLEDEDAKNIINSAQGIRR